VPTAADFPKSSGGIPVTYVPARNTIFLSFALAWAEVLDADAFSYFQQTGIFNKETASSFRKNILEKGGSEKPAVLYKKFRGQEPSIEPLLIRSGLK